MEGRVAIVFEVWALEVLRIVLYDAFEETEVAEVDCAADSDGYVNCHICLLDIWESINSMSRLVEALKRYIQSRKTVHAS